MAVRTNISSYRTKKLMSEVLVGLIKQKPIEKITVRDITEKCGINRQTFYYHFHDIYQLAEWMFREKATEILEDNQIPVENWDRALLAVACFVKENRYVIQSVVHSVGAVRVSQFMSAYVRPYIVEVIRSEAGANTTEADERIIDFLSDYYIASVSTVILEWALGNIHEGIEAEELIRLIKLTIATNPGRVIVTARKEKR